jgi:hypothetical protein
MEQQARKIPLDDLLNHLTSLYNLGIIYIDLHIEQGEDQDVIGIMFYEDYIENKFKSNFEQMENEHKIGSAAFDPNDIDDII